MVNRLSSFILIIILIYIQLDLTLCIKLEVITKKLIINLGISSRPLHQKSFRTWNINTRLDFGTQKISWLSFRAQSQFRIWHNNQLVLQISSSSDLPNCCRLGLFLDLILSSGRIRQLNSRCVLHIRSGRSESRCSDRHKFRYLCQNRLGRFLHFNHSVHFIVHFV